MGGRESAADSCHQDSPSRSSSPLCRRSLVAWTQRLRVRETELAQPLGLNPAQSCVVRSQVVSS